MWDKFLEQVRSNFNFLETELGFTCKETKLPFVIYESRKLLVLVYYDANGRHELDLIIKRIGDDPRKSLSVGIGMLIRLRDEKNTEGYMCPFPATESDLEVEVKHLAELLRKYGADVLNGDLSDFDRIEQLERELAKKYGPKTTFSGVSPRSDTKLA